VFLSIPQEKHKARFTYEVVRLKNRLEAILNASYDRLPSGKEATPKQMFQLVKLGFMEDVFLLVFVWYSKREVNFYIG